jgi:hypothetical protein
MSFPTQATGVLHPQCGETLIYEVASPSSNYKCDAANLCRANISAEI